MGVERVLQAARAVAILLVTATLAVAAPKERVAVIDLGPPDAAARAPIVSALVTAGLDALDGGGIEDALAGEAADADAVQLAAALAQAQQAFGALDCKTTLASAKTAIGIAAARQASGLAVPELPRAWTYVLLCADRAGDTDAALHAAGRLRALGGSSDVPADVWAKYPEVDAMLDRELHPLTVAADIPGAEIWIDFVRAGAAPVTVTLPAGEHVIAAAKGTRRGWAAGTVVKTQPTITVATSEQRGPHAALAARIVSWKGALPSPAELGAVLDAANVRVAMIRRGDRLEAWGRVGKSEPPRRLGGDDGTGTLDEAERLARLIADRVTTWNDRAPDPDVPLLVEDRRPRDVGTEKADEPTKWWVYAAIGGALAIAGGVVWVTEGRTNIQRVELNYP